jgi:hypothetical protein
VEAEPRRFHFASSGMMAVGEGDHLMLHHLSTRLVGDGDGRRSRVELVGVWGKAGCYEVRASGMRVVRVQQRTYWRVFLERKGQHDVISNEGIRK